MISTNSLLKKTKTPQQIKSIKSKLKKLTKLNPVQCSKDNYIMFISVIYGINTGATWSDKFNYAAHGRVDTYGSLKKSYIQQAYTGCFWDITRAIQDITVFRSCTTRRDLRVYHSTELNRLDLGKGYTRVSYAVKH